eukprot:12853729-Alexandrium_andersonii.AAC.1
MAQLEAQELSCGGAAKPTAAEKQYRPRPVFQALPAGGGGGSGRPPASTLQREGGRAAGEE